jgi:hypothetical protein
MTLSATGVTSTTAQLRGTVNPNGAATQAAFEWGPTAALGNITPTINLLSGNTAVPIASPLSSLSPNTIYYYRARATNPDNTQVQYGTTRTFTTAP